MTIRSMALLGLLFGASTYAWAAPPPTGVEMIGAADGGPVLHVILVQSNSGQFFSGISNLTQQANIPITASGVAFQQDNNEQLQVIAYNISQVRHAIRDANGNWTAWGDVLKVVGSIPGNIQKIAICTSQGVMNVLILSSNGRLYYSRRSDSDRTWTQWEDIRSVVGDRGFILAAACATNSGTGLQVGIVTSDGMLWHAIRNASSGAWTPFGNVIAAAGGGISGVTEVGMVQDPSGDMQIMVSTTNEVLWHSVRNHFTGTWTNWGYVFGQTGSLNVAVTPEEISGTAGEFGEVEWVVDWNGQPYWTTRNLDGTWTQFQNLKGLGFGANFISFHVSFYFTPF